MSDYDEHLSDWLDHRDDVDDDRPTRAEAEADARDEDVSERILSVTTGDDFGTFLVHYSDGTTVVTDRWSDAMQAWHVAHYGVARGGCGDVTPVVQGGGYDHDEEPF